MISSILKHTFQTYTMFGLSVHGCLYVLVRTRSSPLSKLGILATTTGALWYFFKYCQERVRLNRQQVLIVTGCDSGLGFSMALQAVNQIKCSVLALVQDRESNGAKLLHKNTIGNHMRLVEIDLRDEQSIRHAVAEIEQYFHQNPDSELFGLVNNAGVMVFGEFEWQTFDLISKQINVNVLGTMKLTNALAPLLRKYSSRIVNIVSHCGLNCLPGLTIYGATKAALMAWSDGLQHELDKFNCKVIKFLPGSFIESTRLMRSHAEHAQQMQSAMTNEQFLFYHHYFTNYNSYLSVIGDSLPEQPIQSIRDQQFSETFADIIELRNPRKLYICETIHYFVYRMIFTYCPSHTIRNYFVAKFMQMPSWSQADDAGDEDESDCCC